MNTPRSIAFYTLGCKLNFAETSAIGRELVEKGYQKRNFDQHPDVYLINTCSVTENADRECRTIVNRALEVNPEAVIVVTGCYAQLKPDDIAAIPGVDLVLGSGAKFRASELLDGVLQKGTPRIHSCEINEVTGFRSSWSEGDRTRVFLKVQDGCDYPCTYCTIPLARGMSRSHSVSGVLEEIRQIEGTGAGEVVLTGVNLGDFGMENGTRRSDFIQLAKAIEELPTTLRFRISSMEPNLLTNELIALVACSDKFVPHFHLPLQSGSDHILKKMRRRYLTPLYHDRVEQIRKQIPDASIGVDVIVGFPGETEEDFLATYHFLNELEVSYLHVFTYSEREHTVAADMQGPVPGPLRKERNRRLRILSEKKYRAFCEKHLGSVRPVLLEAGHKKGMMHGYTDNYIRVATPYQPERVNQMVNCRLLAIGDNGDVEMTIIENDHVTKMQVSALSL